MDYRILGPLELWDGERTISLPGNRQRALLALLLIHRNEVVAPDRLIDALWGAEPPPSAGKALQNAVSQVRRALADGGPPAPGPLRTEPGGYILRVQPDEVDADRFDALVGAGRDALERGEPAVAQELLSRALALWRGPPLADLAYEAFAQPEITRLEEQRVAAIEERVEAELALGRGGELVSELQAAVRHHPLQERLRGQLMLALYRSGRQADALQAFHDARATLLDELGIEPGPSLRELHEAILRQDPALAPAGARRRRPPASARSASRARLRLLAGAGALLVAAAAAAAVVVSRGEDERPAASIGSVRGNSIVALDARTGRVTAVYPAGSTPTDVAVGGGATWGLNADDSTLTRVDLRTSVPRTFAVPDTPMSVAAGPEAVWAMSGTRGRFGGQILPRRLVELAPATGSVVREVVLPRGESTEWFTQNRLAVGRTAIWVIGSDDDLLRVQPGEGTQRVRRVTASGVVADGDGAWALTTSFDSDVLVRISASGRVTARVPVVAAELDGLAAGGGTVWVTAPQEGLLWRVAPGSARSIDVGAGARGVALAGGGVWVANATRGTLTRIDPQTNRVTTVVRLGNAPRAVAGDGNRLWVSVAAGGGVPARDAARAASRAVTAPACGGVIAGAGTPQRLIVSDLPLHQPGLSPMADAIAFILRRHEFRAGAFRIGYQSCDDSTAQQGEFEPEKCRANAALYAQTPAVVGIVGPFNSDCAIEQLAITNRAPGGPLATISPTNTFLGLTKPVPGGPPGQIERLYPTGRRHYARLWGSDDAQGAALARFASDQGWERLAIVRDDSGYGGPLAWHARRHARRLGVPIGGVREVRLEGRMRQTRVVARRVAASRPDAVLYAGLPYGEGLELVRTIRRRLGLRVPILAPDAWLRGPEIFAEFGPAARNIYVASPGLPLEHVGPEGRRFVEEFGRTQPGGVVTVEALYAAQATEVLLEAIARSDGTRASVSQALLDTDLRDSLVGDVRFDADGDVRPRPFAVVRLTPSVEAVNGVEPGGRNIAAVVSP